MNDSAKVSDSVSRRRFPPKSQNAAAARSALTRNGSLLRSKRILLSYMYIHRISSFSVEIYIHPGIPFPAGDQHGIDSYAAHALIL